MKKIILFGAGMIGREAIEFYGEENVEAFCDNNPNLYNKYVNGKRIINADDLTSCHEKYRVVISVRDFDKSRKIMSQLQSLDIPYSLYGEEADRRSNQEIFTDIYTNHHWGTWHEPFFSGTGSHTKGIIDPYISLLTDLIRNNSIRSITDIGCGDFWIMRRVINEVQPHPLFYHGVDVVESLIEYNREAFGGPSVLFSCMDACDKSTRLPEADLLIIRQVLQHLSNSMIKKLLQKIGKFRYVLITEHIYEGDDAIYNLDKPTNGENRLYEKSGVFLEKEPYIYQNLVHLLRVKEDIGVIRTSLLIHETKADIKACAKNVKY